MAGSICSLFDPERSFHSSLPQLIVVDGRLYSLWSQSRLLYDPSETRRSPCHIRSGSTMGTLAVHPEVPILDVETASPRFFRDNQARKRLVLVGSTIAPINSFVAQPAKWGWLLSWTTRCMYMQPTPKRTRGVQGRIAAVRTPYYSENYLSIERKPGVLFLRHVGDLSYGHQSALELIPAPALYLQVTRPRSSPSLSRNVGQREVCDDFATLAGPRSLSSPEGSLQPKPLVSVS